MHTSLPTGTVTFLFTDIEGSTDLAQQYPAEMPSLLSQHHEILRQSIEAYQGYVFRIAGDAFCAAFFTANDALGAALQAQSQLQHAVWHPAPIKVRMGVHTGPAQAGSSEELSDIYSGYLTLTRVQRIMSTANGGQVLISSATSELLHGELPEGVELRDMGEHRLKGLLNPEHLWQATAPGMQSEFPALPSLNAIPNNLPEQLNSFIGREHELAQTKSMLANTRLLTLIGPGGTGKTRLTLQLAAEVLPEFADGVWLVELAPLADPALVLQTIAATLGLREIPGVSQMDMVTHHLQPKRLLLILDNCEHLIETCAGVVDHLLHGCPKCKIISSSREALGIAGETVYRVPPLALPDTDVMALETLHRSEAIQLFLERAAAVKSGFVLDEANAPAVAQICQRLDGIPLALELAAARVWMLTPQQIATRLDDRFRLLTGGSRTALPRQQTLRSLIDWSYDLLSEPERLLFCQLAVFVGGWSLEAAEAVCPDLDVLELLTQLVKKSLVAAEELEDATPRFHLLETIRQYARDRLLELETNMEVRNRHLDYYLKFAEAGEANSFGPQRRRWLYTCELEHDNFRAALQWALEYDVEAAMRLCGALATFWGVRGYIIEGRNWVKAALDRELGLPEPQGEQASRQRQAALARGLLASSQMSYGDGDYQGGLRDSQAAVQIYRQLGNPFELAFSLCHLGSMAAYQSDLDLAEGALTEAIQLARRMGDKVILCYGLGVLSSNVMLPRGDIEAARTYAEESMRFAREIGMEWGVAQGELILVRIARILGQWDELRQHALSAAAVFQDTGDPLVLHIAYIELGDTELCAGNLLEAERYHRQCILAFQQFGNRAFISHGLESFAFIAQARNQPERTARLLGAAEGLREGIGVSEFGVERLENEYKIAVAWLHAQFDETAYRTHWDEGCDMGMDQAIAYALETI